MNLKKLSQNILTLLQRDVSHESESNNLSILVRILCVIGVAHYIPQLFLITLMHTIFPCFALLLGIGLLVGALLCSYEKHIPIAVSYGIYSFVTVGLSILFSLTLGLNTYYLLMIPIAVLMSFYSLKLSHRFKRWATIMGSLLILCTITIFTFLPHYHIPSKVIAFCLLILNLSHFSFCLAIEGFSFCQKYSQSEEKILQYNKKLEIMVLTDALTSLWNRRAMNEHLLKLQSDYTRHQKEFTVAILDIDLFKSVNDTYGHGVGDTVLMRISEILQQNIEGHGHVARWGGEEFLITFEAMPFEKAVSIMEKIREKISKETFSVQDNTFHITITAGMEEFGFRSTIDSIITKADEKLYKGKTSGRNQTVSSLF